MICCYSHLQIGISANHIKLPNTATEADVSNKASDEKIHNFSVELKISLPCHCIKKDYLLIDTNP